MKVTAHLHFVKPSYAPEGKFELWPCKIDWDKEKMFIETLEVEVPDTNIPTKEEITSYLVTGLKKEKEDIQAATHLKLAAIDEQIQQLLCLTYQSPVTEEGATSHEDN